MGQSNPAARETAVSIEIPEEIVVFAQKSILHLRAEMYQAEDVSLEKFNLLNTVRDFEFKCEFITLLETRARKRICVPRFAKRYESQVAAAMVRDGSFQTPPHFVCNCGKNGSNL